MNTKRISKNFSQSEIQSLYQVIGTIEGIFDFDQGVSPKEMPRMLRIGPHNLHFIGNMQHAVREFPWLTPGYLPNDALDEGLKLYQQIEVLEAQLKALISKVRDTMLVAGHHLVRDSLDMYQNLKKAVQRGVSGAKAYFDRVKWRFDRGRKKGEAVEGVEFSKGGEARTAGTAEEADAGFENRTLVVWKGNRHPDGLGKEVWDRLGLVDQVREGPPL